MNAAKKIVNDLMVWLNARYGIALPVLPLQGWTQAAIALWNKTVDWLPGSSPEPTSIDVDGEWKPFDQSNFTVSNIRIEIRDSEQHTSVNLQPKRKAP